MNSNLFARRVGVLVLVAVSVALTAVFGARSTAATGPTGGKILWTDQAHVVGGPVADGGSVLVYVTGADKSVWLEAIDAKTGSVTWRLAAGFSEITPGVETTPLSHDGYALALVPAGASSGLVRLEGVAVSTGKIVWRSTGAVYVADAPTACPKPFGARAFCVVVQFTTGGSALVAIAPKTGTLMTVAIQNIERQLSTTPGLFETTSQKPTLSGIATPGGARWTEPVSKLFGAKADPNNGWVFDQFGSVEVGTVQLPSPGKSEALGGTKTIGFSEATGRRIWSIPGTFQCGGQDGLHGAYLCLMTGTATFPSPTKTTFSKNATATLEGFNPATGRITWKQPIGDLADEVDGNVAITDADHVVITTVQGQKRVLDLRSGATTAVGTAWCAQLNVFKIRAPKGFPAERLGSSLFTPCDANMHPVSTPARPPAIVGATVGNAFIWAAKNKLQAATASP